MLNIDLRGKKAFIVGIADDMGFGFPIAKALAEAGAEIIIGTWTPLVNIFETSWKNKKFDESRKLNDGSLFNYIKLYAIDAAFDTPDDVPNEIKENKRYKNQEGYTISEVAQKIKNDFGQIDILVHSLANSPEITKPLIETSRKGYLSAISASAYSFVSLIAHFGKIMKENGAALALTYLASTRVIPGYGGGMSSAKAALESDMRTLSFEAFEKYKIRLNCISAGPLKSRAAKAIGMIEDMIKYSKANAPLKKELYAKEVANAAAFLLSDLASAITGETLFVDNGLHAMGMAIDSKSFNEV
ncbi:MAG: Enoyl-[acyl-carrier-protein] reductase [NADH] FabI [Candidatus Anoxychlamydiales bacterium]|nr:Enoyl-[acyl-carrier-protein] reductase [NADH] FabI [Candidatus Anoxychlamydiales bacterium]NGX36160.1 Enoyl-[acyl-carrier-protein] reductase [NADH] FabI [Candidatus Anoxychlamydiales bacterium]